MNPVTAKNSSSDSPNSVRYTWTSRAHFSSSRYPRVIPVSLLPPVLPDRPVRLRVPPELPLRRAVPALDLPALTDQPAVLPVDLDHDRVRPLRDRLPAAVLPVP